MDQDYSETTPALPVPEYVPRPKPTSIPTAAWNDAPLFCLQINDQWVSHVLGVLTALDQPDTWLGTEDEIFAARQQVNEIMLALMAACPPRFYSLWDTPTPEFTGTDDAAAVELGLLFHTSIAGNIHGLRFYKAATNTGTHTGHLFAHDASLLGSLTFMDETADGWQVGYFDEPIAIEACAGYVAAYHAPNGNYSYDRPFFDVPLVVPPLYAPASVDFVLNGLYGYGAPGTFPENTYETTNYYVDVIFEPTGADYLE